MFVAVGCHHFAVFGGATGATNITTLNKEYQIRALLLSAARDAQEDQEFHFHRNSPRDIQTKSLLLSVLSLKSMLKHGDLTSDS